MGLFDLPSTGPDSWQGIKMALRCMAIMALTAGGARASGIWYVGIMNQFGVSREVASWPLSIMGAMLSLIGVVAGPMAQIFSPKPVILVGSLLMFTGLFSSYFASSSSWLVLTFGFIFGSGLGTVITINAVFLQQYFVNMRGLALGLNCAGSTTAGFVFPVFLSYLLNEFGLRGTFLIFSGIILHVFALCLMHHEAPWLKRKSEKKSDVSKDVEKTNQQMTNGQTGIPLEKSSKKEAATSEPVSDKPTFIQSLSVLKIPEFLLIILTFSLFVYTYDAYFTTIVDFVVDRGVPLLTATTIIPLYSTTDMVARLTVPQLGDHGYINKKLLLSIVYAVQSACYFALPIVGSYNRFMPIAVVCMVHSIGVGSSVVMYGVMMADSVGPARLPISYGIVGGFVGVTYFTKPYFVGYFRDKVGDYALMFYTCGCLMAISSLIWLITWYYNDSIKSDPERPGAILAIPTASKEDRTAAVLESDICEGSFGENAVCENFERQRSRTDSATLHH